MQRTSWEVRQAGLAPRHRLALLLKALVLPLLAVVFLNASLVPAFFWSTDRIGIWIDAADADLAGRVAVVRPEWGTRLVAASSVGETAPEACGRGASKVVAESSDRDAGNLLYQELRAAGLPTCGGLEVTFNVVPSSPRTVERWSTGWRESSLLLLGVIAATLVYRRYADRPNAPLAARTHLRNAAFGMLGAAGVYACMRAVMLAFPAGQYVSEPPVLSVMTILSMSVLAPYLEEISFRAWLLPLASRAVGAVGAIAVSAITFSLVHGVFDIPHLVFYASAGLVFALVWQYTRSLLACVVAHGGYNTGVLQNLWG